MILNSLIADEFRITAEQKKALQKLGLHNIRDLLFYFPARYNDLSQIKNIIDLIPGEIASIHGEILAIGLKRGFRSKIPMAQGVLRDTTGKIKVTWFNQAFVGKILHMGEKVKLTGKVTLGKHGIYLANPEYEKIKELPDITESLFNKTEKIEHFHFPVYGESKGITSKWIYHAIEKIITDNLDVQDYIPKNILKKYNLPTLKTALFWIHMPKRIEDTLIARKRFAFEEIFFIQLERAHDKLEYAKNKSFKILNKPNEVENFIKRFPFELTSAQKKSVEDIMTDLRKDTPMTRLLEGDVGSGKTAVAAIASFATISNKPFDNARGKQQDFGNLQASIMAPTEILATQHFNSFIELFRHLPINIALITGKSCKKFPSKVNPAGWTNISRPQLLKWVANGEIPILIGTHTLIQKLVKFKNLALAIIDEQHRFGVTQRSKFIRRDARPNVSELVRYGQGFAPHLLSMTATPIPRTLALTIYGDLDLTVLDEMPAGRKRVITEIIPTDKRDVAYNKIKEELKVGRQLYVICPRIEEPDQTPSLASDGAGKEIRVLEMKAVTTEAKRLKKEVFSEYEIGVLHSKMSKDKKELEMENFNEGKIDILCATSVIEVGVNVPNATMILIEGAERFGLAQLHQLRGRVIRSNHQAYCFVFTESESSKTMDRLKALVNAKNGFELAELDLTLRGAGELGGGQQWGITDLGMEAIKNIKMVEAARTEAKSIIASDPELNSCPLLKQTIKKRIGEFHFE